MRFLFGILVLVLAFGLHGSRVGQILGQSYRTEHNIELGGETISDNTRDGGSTAP